MSADLLNLPWQIQVSLASGYAAYMIAYIGLKENHRAIDTVLLTLVFGLVATASLWLMSDAPSLVAGAGAFAITCAVAATWRKWGLDVMHWAMRKGNLSWGNDDPSALATLTRSTKHYVTQVGVALDDGSWLTCEDTSQFATAPFGPCVIGPSGRRHLFDR